MGHVQWRLKPTPTWGAILESKKVSFMASCDILASAAGTLLTSLTSPVKYARYVTQHTCVLDHSHSGSSLAAVRGMAWVTNHLLQKRTFGDHQTLCQQALAQEPNGQVMRGSDAQLSMSLHKLVSQVKVRIMQRRTQAGCRRRRSYAAT
jgi:hypothetical protein